MVQFFNAIKNRPEYKMASNIHLAWTILYLNSVNMYKIINASKPFKKGQFVQFSKCAVNTWIGDSLMRTNY